LEILEKVLPGPRQNAKNYQAEQFLNFKTRFSLQFTASLNSKICGKNIVDIVFLILSLSTPK
jgi:hypothetical protein